MQLQYNRTRSLNVVICFYIINATVLYFTMKQENTQTSKLPPGSSITK